MSRILAAALAVLIAAPTLAAAQSGTTERATPNWEQRVDRRQASQDRRIDQGVTSGQLTRREAARLDRGQNRVDRMENRALADGTMTAREGRRVNHAQNAESRRIYRQKHDRQVRPRVRG